MLSHVVWDKIRARDGANSLCISLCIMLIEFLQYFHVLTQTDARVAKKC